VILPFATPPHSLCLLRLSALGDVTHVVPIIRTLQTHWPQTRLTWIVGKREAELVSDLPGVEFIIFDKRGGLSAHRELWQRLRARRFDVLLHMQVSLRANVVSRAVRAPIRLGFDRVRSKDLHGLFINARIPAAHGQHVLDGFFAFLETVGLNERELRWDLPVPSHARLTAERHIPPTQHALVISPCSSDPPRDWHVERYAEVADHAAKRWGMRIVLCGGPTSREREYGRAIVRLMRESAVNLIGQTSVKELLAVLARARVLLTPDSGPAHLATSVGTPVIGLYAASNSGRTGPYLSRQWCVDKYDAAARRYHGRSACELAWGTKLEYGGVMGLIAADEVIERLDELMTALSGQRRVNDAAGSGMPKPAQPR
jgi:heptosyltransferase I